MKTEEEEKKNGMKKKEKNEFVMWNSNAIAKRILNA